MSVKGNTKKYLIILHIYSFITTDLYLIETGLEKNRNTITESIKSFMCVGNKPIKLCASETSKLCNSNVMTSLSLPSQRYCQGCKQMLNTEKENKRREGYNSAEDLSVSAFYA